MKLHSEKKIECGKYPRIFDAVQGGLPHKKRKFFGNEQNVVFDELPSAFVL